MRVGIDIDGVLTNIERFILDYGSKYCLENNIPLKIKEGIYDEQETFGWTEEQTIKFWNEYIIYYATEYPAREFASEVIKKLKEDGHEIYLLTARNNYGVPSAFLNKMPEIVPQWLKENDIIYDKIIYTEGSKLPYCVGNYIDVMVEDKPENIIDVATKIPVINFVSFYNAKVTGNNITKAYSWYEVYDIIKDM